MKKKTLKIIALLSAFAFACCLAVRNVNKNVEKVEAVQCIDNFDDYYYTGTYYDNTDLTGTYGLNGTLRTALTSLIHPTSWYTYGSSGTNHLSTQLQYADEDPNNSSNMIYLYTRDSVKKNAASSWNREHVWPQSLSGKNSSGGDNWGTTEAGADLLHIRPTYNKTNEIRGNDKYGDNNKSNPIYYNNMLYGYTGSGSYFEPLDSVKGDVARIIMYVWTAYKSHYSNLPNITNVFQSYDVLLQWHTLDKPDVMEGKRNDYSQTSVQKNRNPFVDHPEFAWQIFGDSASSSVKTACIDAYPGDGTPPVTKTLTKVEITGEANKKNYYAGESFDPTGLTVTAYYDDESTKSIPLTNCTWSPNPLTEGTTSVTCTYGSRSATYNGITVTKRDTVEGQYSVEFTMTADSGTEINANNISNYYESNTLIQSASNFTKIFPGEKGLKFGSSSVNGSVTFTLVNAAQNNIAKVTIKTTSFKGSGTFDATLGNTSLGSGINAGNDLVKVLSDVSAFTITISSSGRMYLNSITVEIAGVPTPPPSSSSSMPSTSSEAPFSSSESSSAQDSSTVYSDSSSQNNTSTHIDDSSSGTGDSSSEGGNKKSSGCGGSITMILPLTGFSALIGLVFIFSKKKK